MKTPDQEVTDRIFQQFRNHQLLSEKGIQKIESSLQNGTLKAEDWRLLFETDRLKRESGNVDKSL